MTLCRLWLLLWVFALGLSAQTSSGIARHIQYGSTLPSRCSKNTGDVFFLTTGTIGVYECIATNTWSMSARGSIPACVGTPGNTTGPYGSLCEVRATGALWGCVNASGCTVSADWASAGGGSVTVPGTAGQLLTSDGAGGFGTSVTPANAVQRCTIMAGADNGPALGATDIAPQTGQCQVPATATVLEVDVLADAGTSSVNVAKRHCSTITAGVCAAWTVTALLSGELATVTGGFPACARSATAQTCYSGITSSATVNISTVALGAGDYIETSAATLAGAPKRYTITVFYQ